MRDKGEPIFYPPNPAEYITDWLFEIGPVAAGAMGPVPIGWQDMAAWERLTGNELDPWEARTIRRLSQAYVAQAYEAENLNCPEPRLAEEKQAEARREKVTQQFSAMIRAAQARKAAEPPRRNPRNRKVEHG